MKKIAFIGALAATVLLSATAVLLTGVLDKGGGKAPMVQVIALERQRLEQSVRLAGTVCSAQSTEVYSTLGFPVEAVKVGVGDRVSEGDLLAVLDMSSLEMDIRQLQASLGATQALANQNLATSRNALETFRRNVEAGNDGAILQARLGVNTAHLAVQAAEVEVSAASRHLSNARQDLREYRRYHDFDGDFDPTLSQLRAVVATHETALDRAQSNLAFATEHLAHAQQSYEAAQILSADALVAHQEMVRTAELSANFGDQQIAIQRMQNELEKAEILAPVSGTVTAVLAEKGAPGAGLLFVIQDTDNLIIKTSINELDLALVDLGDGVTIRADATGDATFTGTLTRIAPASTPGGSYAAFESEVAVSGTDGLKLGMSTRLLVVGQARSNVFALPVQAIAANEFGEDVIFVAVPVEGGSYLLEAVAVATGLKAGRQIEVSADSLADGVLVVRNTEGMQAGMFITPHLTQ